MLLRGFGFSGYRSFGNELAKIAPLKKVNLIIGQNNAGKSNVIRFLKEQYSFYTQQVKGQSNSKQGDIFSEIDCHISDEEIIHRIAYPLFLDDLEEYIKQQLPDERAYKLCSNYAKEVLTKAFLLDDDCIWFVYKSTSPQSKFDLDLNQSIKELSEILDYNQWQSLWNVLIGNRGGSLEHTWVPETIKRLSYVPQSLPDVEVISAIRKIGVTGENVSDYSGVGIIDRLAKIQNPSLTDQEEKNKFEAINQFIQSVLENSSAKIEVPYDRDMILVHMDGKTLPLESLGTGVHEVIILAAAATVLENTVLCIEEPELHLHPLLQKRLVEYLASETNNQYFFTTHSAHLLDAAESEIFHITYGGKSSAVEAISSTKKKSNICNDLGYRASDILQSNCIIWVEGPSDRIYLNYWLKAKRSDLKEGVHYSIMFYGGRLFSHLTALDDDEIDEKVEDFVAIRQLNRNTTIIFDSDKSNSREGLSKTKKRLKNEFDKGPGFAWVTEGREIENYLQEDKVEEAILVVHPTAKELISKSKWSNLLKYRKKRNNENKEANKVKVAKYYTEQNAADFSIFDLDTQLEKLVNFISDSN